MAQEQKDPRLASPQIDLKTDRRNSTTKESEEVTLKKVGSVETWFRWFRGEMDHGCCAREGTVVMEKGQRDKERKRSTQGNSQGEHFPIAIGQWGLNSRVLQVPVLAGKDPVGHCTFLERRQENNSEADSMETVI